MILNTWVLGLLVGQVTIFIVISFSGFNALRIYLNWNYASSDERQYLLENKTYLVAALMKFAMFVHLFLFALTALALDEIAPMIIGAMCPVGVLASNAYGFPFLYIKMGLVFIFSIWLVLNHLDNKMDNYPLVRLKYLYLILFYPLVIIETILFLLFLFNLDPMVITSCCGTVFSEANSGVTGTMSSISNIIILPTLFGLAVLLLFCRFIIIKKLTNSVVGGIIEAVIWIFFFIFSILSVLSFISIYIYEMPTHRCPFCFLQQEYGFIGFPLYFFLFLATAAGFNRGILELIKWEEKLAITIANFQSKLHKVAIIAMLGFLLTGFLPFVFYYFRTGRLI